VRDIALVALSAACYVAAFPPFGWHALAWVALVPLLAALDRDAMRASRVALLGGLWALLATAGVIAWVVPTLEDYFRLSLPWAMAVFLFVVLAAAVPYLAVVAAGTGLLRARLPRIAWLLSLPLAWTVFEFARTSLGLRSGWARLGDSLAGVASVRELASVTGVWGVSALAILANVALYEGLCVMRRRWLSGERVSLRRVSALVAGLVMGFAGAQWARAPLAMEDGSGGEIVLVPAAVEAELRWKRAHAPRSLGEHVKLTLEALRGAPDPLLVVWPENAIQISPADPEFGIALRTLVSSIGVPLLMGAPRSERERPGESFNSAHLLWPDGRSEAYDKMRLLPISETGPLVDLASREAATRAGWVPGESPGVFDLATKRIGVLICFEAIYPDLARALAGDGARLLLNLSNDGWYRGRGGHQQHLQQVVYRAIETGVPLARATTTGITAIVAPDGSIVASLPADQPGALRASIPALRPGGTPYVRLGDTFAWTSVVVWCALVAWCVRRRWV